MLGKKKVDAWYHVHTVVFESPPICVSVAVFGLTISSARMANFRWRWIMVICRMALMRRVAAPRDPDSVNRGPSFHTLFASLKAASWSMREKFMVPRKDRPA